KMGWPTMSVRTSSGRRSARASHHENPPDTATEAAKRQADLRRLAPDVCNAPSRRSGGSAVSIDGLELETGRRGVPVKHLHGLQRKVGEVGPEHWQLLQ